MITKTDILKAIVKMDERHNSVSSTITGATILEVINDNLIELPDVAHTRKVYEQMGRVFKRLDKLNAGIRISQISKEIQMMEVERVGLLVELKEILEQL